MIQRINSFCQYCGSSEKISASWKQIHGFRCRCDFSVGYSPVLGYGDIPEGATKIASGKNRDDDALRTCWI